MDRIKTAADRRLRREGLSETTLPIPYDPAAMPGAVVLASDGRAYQSLKDGATYQWRKLIAATPSNEVVIGGDVPRAGFMIMPGSSQRALITPQFQTEGRGHFASAASIVRLGNDNDPARLFLGKLRDNPLSQQPPSEYVAAINFAGVDGYSSDLILGASISARSEAGGVEGHVPMAIVFRVRPVGAGPTAFVDGLTIASDGKVRINNTTGTEQFSVAGNAELTQSGNTFKINGNPVVGARKTGWAAASGTATRTAFDTSTVTASQLAERVKALIDDLVSHGLIGA